MRDQEERLRYYEHLCRKAEKYVCGTYELREMRLSQGGFPVSHLHLHKVPIRSERGCISKAATEEKKLRKAG